MGKFLDLKYFAHFIELIEKLIKMFKVFWNDKK
jgi:hypothetical protein